MVNSPNVSGNFKLYTYGMQDIGETPKSAVTDKATPKAITKSPKMNIDTLNSNLFFFIP